MVDIGNNRTLTIPAPATQGTVFQDSLVLTPALHYGVSGKAELYGRASFLSQNSRFAANFNTPNQSDTAWNDLWLGGQYQVFKDHPRYANSLLFGEFSLLSAGQNFKTEMLRAALFGATVYTINDPIVLSLTPSYQFSQSKHFKGGSSVRAGGVFSLNGSLGFAVNPEITLNTGFSWQNRAADHFDDPLRSSTRQTSTDMSVGFAYAVTERSNLNLSLRSNVSGGGGSTLSLQVSSKLGLLPESKSSTLKNRE